MVAPKVAVRNTFPLIILVLIFALPTLSCHRESEQEVVEKVQGDAQFAIEGVDAFLPGDIIVRPNTNLLPGSTRVDGGFLFGHAAFVVRGFRSQHPDTLLANTIIIESMARDVLPGFQVRETPALVYHEREAFSNTNFSAKYAGNRYRLRLQWNDSELDRIITFLREQKGDLSTWNAAKRFPGQAFADSLVNVGMRSNWADNSHWYCSLLVWQAVYYVKGIDLDANGGYMVYPNDLITSPYFDLKHGIASRARF